MKYLDEFRDAQAAQRLAAEIRQLATRRWTIMEVCGGQTHSLLRYGIEAELAEVVELLHGPGCPVCVTPAEAIDFAREIALRHGAIVTSFGDMLRVPGATGSLQEARAAGGDVRMVYSPSDALRIARDHPERQVVFFAVGFETTAPATALALLQARAEGIENFSLLAAHVRVQPAMEQIAAAADRRVDGFLAAGHVCTIVGYESFVAMARDFAMPVVVTGFEPLDLLAGIRECVAQLETGRCEVNNQYARSVREEGNRAAQGLIDQVYEVADQAWRGIGVIPGGGLVLRPSWRAWDAAHRFPRRAAPPVASEVLCRSGEILTGRIKPPDCPHFGGKCTPEAPLGAPMVSSEGACAAYYRYRPAATAAVRETDA